MKIVNKEQGSDEWLEYRKGKISGTTLGNLYSKRGTRKIGFYELIAESLALEPDDENRMERGLRLEDEAIGMFQLGSAKTVERVGICVHDKYPDIINSPDGLIKNKGKYTEAIEIKCLSPARHLQAVIENKVPSEYESQVLQYFIVNPDLETLYFIFYDPRIEAVPMHIIDVHRKDLGDEPDEFLTFQLEQLKEIKTIIEKLAF